MLPKLKISKFLLKRLERVKQQCSGCLFGVFYSEGTLLLMGFNIESSIGQFNYEQIQHKFPAELDLCGIVKFGDCTDAEAHLSEILKDVDITDNPILLHCELGTLVGLKASIFMHGKLEEIPYEIMEPEQLYAEFCFARLKCSLSIYTEQNNKAVTREMHILRKTLSGGSLVFRIEPTKIYVTNANTQGCCDDSNSENVNNESLIADLINAISTDIRNNEKLEDSNVVTKKKGMSGDCAIKSQYGVLGCDYDILNIAVLRNKTKEMYATELSSNTDNNKALPAVSMCVKNNEKKVCVPLEVEAMAILNKNTQVSRLYDILIESICRSLRLFEQSMVEGLNNEKSVLKLPRSYHFCPQEFGHFLTCSYLDGISDDDAGMQDKRKRLHRHFGLLTVRPYFRRTNRCIFINEIPIDSPLSNTHIGLRPSGVNDGVKYLVQGNYYYYHYLQQNVQDKGWGCAYRSLQTICSWFLLQGYTERRIPTHHEIQKYLVSIGDKRESFLDSTQWIGSTEVSMCLQGFLNVESKIIHVTSGAELSTIGSDLAVHFQVQGTPIMIGGGVLAHTIIGIDYNASKGHIKFLILDPHYTGSEDIQVIQSKGWCGWKGVDFWDKKSYYNLCLPQRPIMF